MVFILGFYISYDIDRITQNGLKCRNRFPAASLDIAIDWCHPNSPASLGMNKSSHFRWESTPISQNALLLLVSGKVFPKLT